MDDQELLAELVAAYGGAASPITIISSGLTAEQVQRLYPIASSRSHERKVIIFFDNLLKTFGGRVAAIIPVQFRIRASSGIVLQPPNPTEV